MVPTFFLDNNKDTSFLDEIKQSLKDCVSFEWSVSFIKKAGLVLLAGAIEEALQRGVKGKILTSTYQNFTDIGSLEQFFEWQERFPGLFECHLEDNAFLDNGIASGFHTKGYIFHYPNETKIIIGSSNITRFALLYNKEWDLASVEGDGSSFVNAVKKEFDYLWAKTGLNLTRDMMKNYSQRLQYAVSAWDMDGYVLDRLGKYKPNAMQRVALFSIRQLRAMNVDRALIVAATGSGKTYLSAFDALEAGAKRLLFIAHKDMILSKSMESYMNVFSNTRTYGLFVGGKREFDRDFLFATNVAIAGNLALFKPDEFDYIVIDEVHHAVADTYKKIIEYFRPAFLLGMTATPDRMDKKDVYDLFHDNVPYDLRLRDAIENDLVVPFHYFGIKDQYVGYDEKDIAKSASKLTQQLIADKHIDFILKNVEKHRPQGMGKLKCVVFCRSVSDAQFLCDIFNQKGHHSLSLSGQSSLSERNEAFRRLEDEKDSVNFLFAVDILNEGIDVPSMNMVLFLRPTESSTIFLQQLGRGLRKYKDKPYLTVLDFIGNNYTRAAQIALAFGTMTKTGVTDQVTVREIVSEPTKVLEIPNLVIEFDEKSKQEILDSLSNVNLDSKKFLKKDYENYKAYLIRSGEITDAEFPRCIHYLSSSVPIDLMRFITKDMPSYYEFLRFADPKVAPAFSDDEYNVLFTLSYFLPLARSEEFDILNLLMNKPMTEDELFSALSPVTSCSKESIHHAILVLLSKARMANKTARYVPLIKEENGKFAPAFSLADGPFLGAVKDVIEYGLVRFSVDFREKKGPLMRLGYYYSGAQALLALNNTLLEGNKDTPNLCYESGIQSTSAGLCIFVNLSKDATKEEAYKYEDRFLSRGVLQWETQQGTTKDNAKGKRLINAGSAHIFVRKTKKGEPPFIYLGKGQLTNPRASSKPGDYLLFDIVLEEPFTEEYDYDIGYEEVV